MRETVSDAANRGWNDAEAGYGKSPGEHPAYYKAFDAQVDGEDKSYLATIIRVHCRAED